MVKKRKPLLKRCSICGRFCGDKTCICLSCNRKGVFKESKHQSSSMLDVSEICDLCSRRSTSTYPLVFTPVPRGAVRRGRYGKPLPDRRKRNYVYFCSDCYEYTVNKRRAWRYGWAAVLYSVIFGYIFDVRCKKSIIKLIPQVILESWDYMMNVEEVSVIQDLTHYLAVNPLPCNNFSLAEFIAFAEGGYGFLPFTHLLNYVDSSIRVFGGNGKRLTSISHKWFVGQSRGLFESTMVQSGLTFHEKYGLCIVTCTDHSSGCPYQIIYPPEQPVLGHVALPEADNLTLATIKPRVIKAGRTGLCCSSWSLYTARFSSSGASTFTLSNEVRWRCISSRMARTNKLVVLNRPNVLTGLYERVMQGQLAPFVLRDLLKTNVQVVDDEQYRCLQSATMVDLEDIIEIRKRIIDGISLTRGSVNKVPRYFYAHTTGPHGSRPLTPEVWMLKSESEVGYDPINVCIWLLLVLPTVCGIIGEDILGHSGSSSWHRQCQKPYKRVLGKLFSCDLSKHNELRKSLRRLHNALNGWYQDLNTESDLLTPMTSVTCLINIVEQFFRASGSSIVVFDSSTSRSLSTLFGEFSDDVSWHVLLDRNVRSRLPLIAESQIHSIIDTCAVSGLQVRAVFDFRNSLINPSGYVSHGGCRQAYWECSYGCHAVARDITVDDLLKKKCWSLYIFTRRTDPQVIDNYFGSLMGIIGGQLYFLCGLHKVLLVKETYPSKANCTYVTCDKSVQHKALFSCPYRNICGVGVCRQVYDKVILSGLSNTPILIFPICSDRDSSCIACLDADDGEPTPRTPSIISAHENDLPFFVGDPDVNVAYEQSDEDMPCLLTNKADMPWSFDEVPVAASVLFNSICGVLRRRGYEASMPRYAQRFFQNLMSLSKSPVCLAYPESTLFPSIFWRDVVDNAVGAIPICLHSEKANRDLGFSTYREHCIYRLRDWSSLTASDSRYSLYMFDVVLNTMMHYTTQSLTLKRGWEHISGDVHDVQVNVKEQYLAFDAADSRRNVRELSSLIGEKCPRYFLTLTCNQRGTPCVKLVTTIREEFLSHHPDVPMQDAIESSCTPYVTIWYNWVCLFLDYLYQGKDNILGPISGYWGRFEWQSAEATLPHFHCLLWCDEPIEVSKRRIVCNLSQFASFKESIFDRGLVSSDIEWDDLCDAFCRFQRHSCTLSKGRCQRHGSDGHSYCRVPQYMPSPTTEYSPIKRHLTDEELDIFLSLEWASLIDDNYYQLRPDFQPGRFTYATSGNVKWVPVNPFIFAIFRSSCNLLLVDWDMASRYLASYCGGAEEHVKIGMHAKDDTTVGTELHNLENIKFSRRPKCKFNSFRPRKNDLCKRIVSRTEALFFVLKYRYVHTNRRFSHAQTNMLEDRPVFKRSRRRMLRRSSACGQSSVQIRIRSSLPEM